MNHHLVLVLVLAGAVLRFFFAVTLSPIDVRRFSIPTITVVVVVFNVLLI